MKQLADLFELSADDLVHAGLGQASARQLADGIAGTRRAEWRRWWIALGIPGLGAASERELTAKVGPEVAAQLAAFVRDRANHRMQEVIRGKH